LVVVALPLDAEVKMPKLPPIVPNGPDPPISESPGSWTKWEVPVTVMVPKLVVVALPVVDTWVH
jgi:hypothetical protein